MNVEQNQQRNHAMYAPYRDEAISRWRSEMEEAEADLPAAKKRAQKIIEDARQRLLAAYTGLSNAQVPLPVWSRETHGVLPKPLSPPSTEVRL